MPRLGLGEAFKIAFLTSFGVNSWDAHHNKKGRHITPLFVVVFVFLLTYGAGDVVNSPSWLTTATAPVSPQAASPVQVMVYAAGVPATTVVTPVDGV